MNDQFQHLIPAPNVSKTANFVEIVDYYAWTS